MNYNIIPECYLLTIYDKNEKEDLKLNELNEIIHNLELNI